MVTCERWEDGDGVKGRWKGGMEYVTFVRMIQSLI